MSRERKERLSTIRIVVYFFLLLSAVVSLFPFVWMVSTSLKETTVMFSYPPQLIPGNPTIRNYVFLIYRSAFLAWFKNSSIVTLSVIFLSLLLNSLAGYALAKIKFPGRNLFFILVLGTLMVPLYVRVVPVYLMISKVGWVNTYYSLVLPMSASGLGIFLMRQYIGLMPDELREAGRLDGCSEWRIFWNIILPLCKPGLAALAILTFLSAWNNFLWPLIFITKDSMMTIPVGLALFEGRFSSQWGLIMAGATIAFIPALVLFISLQKYFVSGITLTGMKG